MAISFKAKLHRPAGADQGAPWTFLNLPEDASKQLPSRGMVTVEGTFGKSTFQATLRPDGNGGHWLKVEPKLREEAGVKAGDTVQLEITPSKVEPEPEIPEDFQKALEDAGQKAKETWASITPAARRDWIFWVTSGKKEETRVKRIGVAMDKMSKGNRRPCCFDRSGMYDKSLSCPLAED